MQNVVSLKKLGYNPTQIEVLKQIYLKPGVTRKELSKQTGISGRTIIKFVTEFLDNNIVIPFGTTLKTGGRNATNLAINPNFLLVLAVDVGSYLTKIGIVNILGEVIENKLIPTTSLTVSALREELNVFIDKYDKDKFAGIGISVTGLVDTNKKFISFSPNIPLFNNIDAIKEFEIPLGLPVCIDTSARCLSLAEQKFGFGKGVDNQIFISVGHSISAGIIINGKLFGGANGLAGEIGHVCCDDRKIRCTCGGYDCLEVYSTLTMIISNVKNNVYNFIGYSPTAKLVQDSDDFDHTHVLRGIELKDKIVIERIEKIGEKLGYVISNMINTLNPELIIFGGSVTELISPVIDSAINTINSLCLAPAVQNLKIEKSTLGVNGAIIGSATQVLNKFFEV